MKNLLDKVWFYYAAPIAVLIVVFSSLYYFGNRQIITDLYQRKFQTPIFTGFLTISGFLLSLKALVVFKLHEGIYSKSEYEKIVGDLIYHQSTFDPYESLKQLATFLLTCVSATLITSFSQLTIGQIPFPWASILCLSIAAAGASYVLAACFVIKRSLGRLFEAYSKELKEKIKNSLSNQNPN